MRTLTAILCAALLTGCMQSTGGYRQPNAYELQRRQNTFDMGMMLLRNGMYGSPNAYQQRAYVGQPLRY